SPGEAEPDRHAERDERHWWRARVFQVRPRAVQSPGYGGDFCGEPEIERECGRGDDRGGYWRNRRQSINQLIELADRGRFASSDDLDDLPQAVSQRAPDRRGIGPKREQGNYRGQRAKSRYPEQDATGRIPLEIGRNPRCAVS